MDIAAIADSQVGYTEEATDRTIYNEWFYGSNTSAAWCAIFIAWCANKAGVSTSIIPKNASASASGIVSGMTPITKSELRPGDIVRWNSPAHVAIVVEAGADPIVVDGNCSNKVAKHKLSSQTNTGLSYYRPSYASIFTPRLTDPATNNTYYIHTSYGGLNECIRISGDSVLPNCVGYAWGRAYEITGKKPTLSKNNANTFWGRTSDGYKRGQEPRLGAIVCWNSGSAGHVAVVEKIEGDYITISESSYGGARFRTRSLKIGSYGSNFQGFIYILGEGASSINIGTPKNFRGNNLASDLSKAVFSSDVNTPIALAWDAVPNATRYKIELISWNGTSWVISSLNNANTRTVTGTSTTYSNPPAGYYGFRITAGSAISWSDAYEQWGAVNIVNHPTCSWTSGYDTNHPHREYMACACGARQYLSTYRTLPSCDECTPPGQPPSVSFAPGVNVGLGAGLGNNIGRGDSVKVSYGEASGYAVGYQIDLVCTSNASFSKSNVGTNFTIENPGTYRVDVRAYNNSAAKWSSAAASNTITVHPDVTATYYNNCTVLCDAPCSNYCTAEIVDARTVKYGRSIARTVPNRPTKLHHDFDGWVDMNSITGNCSQTATFTIKQYSVTFTDHYGNRNGPIQYVTALQAATPPAPMNIPAGYAFTGWDNHGYLRVESNITVKQVIAWENPNFLSAVSVESATAVKQTIGGKEEIIGYDVVVRIKGHPELNAKGKIIVSLKTDEALSGLPEKMVAVEIKSFQKFAQPNPAVGDTLETVFVPYTGGEHGFIVTRCEVEVVGILAENISGVSDNTGASIAAKATFAIDLGEEWTGWSTNLPPADADFTESRQEYRYKDKSTTTSSSSSMSGWTLYNTTWVWGSWSAWSQTDPGGATYPNETQNRQKQSRWIPETYKTQYHYYIWCTNANDGWTTKSYAEKQTGKTAYLNETWSDYQFAFNKTAGGMNWYKGYAGQYFGNTNWFVADGAAGGLGTPTRTVVATPGYTEYQYRDKVYTYYFEKWSDWSAWQTTAPTPNANREIETRTVYRYKYNRSTQTFYNYKRFMVQSLVDGNFYPVHDPILISLLGFPGRWEYHRTNVELPIAGSTGSITIYGTGDDTWVKADAHALGDRPDLHVYLSEQSREDLFGTERTVEGTMPAEFGGLIATIMVYKETNTDPTANQLQYISQTTLGPNGEYSFTFRPRQEPISNDPNPFKITGDFLVAIAVEGQLAPSTVQTIYAPRPVYEVLFVDDDGSLLAKQMVLRGDSASLPDAPVKEGHVFIGWDRAATNVQLDMVLKARYIKNQYSVVFIDWDAYFLEIKTFEHGDALTLPDVTRDNGRIFSGWADENGEAVEFVTRNMVVTAQYDLEVYTVNFMNWDGSLISEQSVEHGSDAELPNVEIAPMGEMLFAYWSSYVDYVTEDMDVYPIMMYEFSVESVVASVAGGVYATPRTVALTCSTPDAQIYYTVDGTVPFNDEYGTESTMLYTGPIEITQDTELMFIAVADGMNPSYVGYEEYIIDASIVKRGDANCDGEVSAADAALVLRYLAGLTDISEQGLLNAHVTNGDSIGAADAAMILRYLAGLTMLE